MIGNERIRFCGQCSLNVYNLSALTRSEAERLMITAEGRLCVRYFRRADGSILTDNCPVGLRRIRRRLSYVARAISSAAISFLAGVGIYQATTLVRIERTPRTGVLALPVNTNGTRELKGVTGKSAFIPFSQIDSGKKATHRTDKARMVATR